MFCASYYKLFASIQLCIEISEEKSEEKKFLGPILEIKECNNFVLIIHVFKMVIKI